MSRLIFIPFIYGFGGVERLALSLSRFLYEREIDHSIVTFEDTINLSSHAEWRLPVHVIKAKRSLRDEALAIGQAGVFKDAGSGTVLAFDLKGALYSQFIPRPCVLHLTDPPSLLPTDITRYRITAVSSASDAAKRISHPLRSIRAEAAHRATRRGVRQAREIVVMTNVIAAELRRLYGVAPRVVRPGVNTGVERRSTPKSESLRMLSISRLEPTKRIDWILHALRRLEIRTPSLSSTNDWRFEIVGDGTQRAELENLCRTLGLASRVSFRGWQSAEQVRDLSYASNLFLMPAAQGYGLPALESLAIGVPVIVHRDSGVSEIFSASPWVRMISAADGSDVDGAITDMAQAISRGTLSDYPVPVIPSETEWAAEIAGICGWMKSD